MPEVFRLTPEEQQRLRALNEQIQPIKQTIERAKRIGTIDLSEQEARLEALIRTREGLLREFGAPVIQRER